MSTKTTTEDWVHSMLTRSSVKFGETHGGRIVGSLAKEPNSERRRLGSLLLAAAMQNGDERFGIYLDEVSGVQNSVAARERIVEEVPEDRPEYKRPTGEVYFARKWGEKFWDVEVLKTARAKDKYALLMGPPGTGKTAMAEAAFGDELETVVISGETRVGDLVGGFIPDGQGGYVWADGPLTVAVKEGRPILLDEIPLGDPKVLSVLYPLMDGRGFLNVTDNPEIGIVPAKEGFYIIGAGNPNVPGAQMSEALHSRFSIHVEVTTDWELLERMGIDPIVVNMAASLDSRMNGTGSISWAPQFRELLAYRDLENEWGREFALNNLMRLVPRADYEEVLAIASSVLPAGMLRAAKI